ncbi:MAG: dihydroneopterin triphosphate diphosphatase [Betaproteobacteria bacterium]|nr:MAG: dihydroneopterin triphosphate diphosphatase [Betaproteobacteria bacterium]
MKYKIPLSVLVVIHTPELEVLLIERADRPGFWQSVTGSLDEGETCARTAVREVQEETGIDAARYPLVDWRIQNRFEIFRRWGSRYAPGTTHNTERVFSLTVPSRVPVVLEPREHLRHRWMSWREAAALVFSWSNADALRMLPIVARESAPGEPCG